MLSSSLAAEQRPSWAHGKWSNQFAAAQQARRASLRRRWKRSTIPLDRGWYAVVWACWMLSRLHRAAHREEMNWGLQSDVMTAGTPNLLTIPETKHLRSQLLWWRRWGMASGQQEVLFMIVNRWVKPFDEGRGPTRSTWM